MGATLKEIRDDGTRVYTPENYKPHAHMFDLKVGGDIYCIDFSWFAALQQIISDFRKDLNWHVTDFIKGWRRFLRAIAGLPNNPILTVPIPVNIGENMLGKLGISPNHPYAYREIPFGETEFMEQLAEKNSNRMFGGLTTFHS